MNRCRSGPLLRHLVWLTLAAMPLSSHAIEEPGHEFAQVEMRHNVSAPNSELRQTCLQQGEQV